MSMADIQHAVRDLSEFDRGQLAAWLLDSLPTHSHEDAAPESLAEAVRRRDQLDSGGMNPLSSEEFWTALDQTRATWT
jgi:hypothetical protein